MLTIILEDNKLRHGLFPGLGTTQADGTSSNKMPKSEFEWIVAQRLFADGEHANTFTQSTTTPKGQSKWITKIKNRLTQLSISFDLSSLSLMDYPRMRRIVDECSEMMGETGQGLKSEEEIKTQQNNNLMRTWGEHWTFLRCGSQANSFAVEVKQKCPWYFTLKELISERSNLVPVGLGNNTAEYDTSLLLSQGTNEASPSNGGDDLPDTDEPKEIAEDRELEGDSNCFKNDSIDSSLPDVKATAGEKKITSKKEPAVPAKRPRSQVDWIANAEVAHFECKKVKFEADQQCLKTVASVASVKAQEKTCCVVEIRQAELDLERDKI